MFQKKVDKNPFQLGVRKKQKTQVDADAAEEAAMPYGAAQLVLGMATTNQKVAEPLRGHRAAGPGADDHAARAGPRHPQGRRQRDAGVPS